MNNFDLKKFLVENKLTSNSRLKEGTFDQGEIALYLGPDGLTHIFKRGSGYYGYNDEFDFEAASKEELEQKLKGWGYELTAGSLNENVTTTVWSNFDLQFMIDNNVRMLQGIGGNLQVDWHLIEKGFYGAEEKALKQVADWKESMEESLGIEPQEEVKIVGGKITTDKIEAASDEAASSQASAMKKGGFSNN